jgi:peptidoglycan/xylan/chitin deacetylase (PgdA/CDA1 family)
MEGSMPMSELARRGVRLVASAVDRVAPPADGVVILIYHRVGAGTASRVDLPTSVFRDHIAELAESERVVGLDVALDVLAGRIEAPHPHPVVVTFDDGTGDFLDHAVPILAEHSIPTTLYVATRWIDEEQPFWGDGTTALSWAGMTEAMASGVVSVGSHTHDHLLFDRISRSDALDQIERSVGLIHDRLATDAVDFCYPKALAPSAENLALVRQHFRSGTLAGTRPNVGATHDPHLLWRTPMQTVDVGRWFTQKTNGGLGLEDRLRDQLNRVRYRAASR